MVWNRSNYYVLHFGAVGAPVTTQFLTPGFGACDANEIQVPVPYQCQLDTLIVNSRVAPGGAFTINFVVNIGGAASAATVDIAAANTTATYNGAVAVAAGSLLSVEVTSANVGASDDITSAIVLLILE